jgi:hypothetical protein
VEGLFICQYRDFPAWQRIARHDESDSSWVCYPVTAAIGPIRVGFFLWRALRWLEQIKFPPEVPPVE